MVSLSQEIARRRLCILGKSAFELLTTAFWKRLFVSCAVRYEMLVRCVYALNLHALSMELMTAGQAHHTADPIDVFFQTHDAFDLPAHVFLPLALFLARPR